MTQDNQKTDPVDVEPGIKLETRTSAEYRSLEKALESLKDDMDLQPQDDLRRMLGNLLAAGLRVPESS